MTHIFSNPSGSVGWNQSQLTYRQHRRLFLSTFHKSFLCSSCIIRNIFVIFLLTKNIFDIGDSTITQESKRNILWAFLPKSYIHPPPTSCTYINTSILETFLFYRLAVITLLVFLWTVSFSRDLAWCLKKEGVEGDSPQVPEGAKGLHECIFSCSLNLGMG